MQTTWKVKERREKTVPIQPALLEFLTRERSKNPDEFWYMGDEGKGRVINHPNSLKGAFGQFMKDCGLGEKSEGGKWIPKAKSIHGLRSLFITTAYNVLGLDLGTIQNLAGHSQIEATRGYVSNTDKRQWEAVKKFAEKETGIGTMLAQENTIPDKSLINLGFPLFPLSS